MKPTVKGSRRRSAVAATVLLAAFTLGGCRGENIFSLTATVSSGEPQVVITAPGAGLTIAPGDSVLVLAEVTAQQGITTIGLSGEYSDSLGGQAYIPATITGSALTFIRVNEYLKPASGQVAGEVYVKVLATDGAGAIARDSVKIAIVSTN
jgi:hypothetical protein